MSVERNLTAEKSLGNRQKCKAEQEGKTEKNSWFKKIHDVLDIKYMSPF